MVDTMYWISIVGWYHLACFGVLIPYMAIRSFFVVKKAPQKLPDRRKHFQRTAATLVLFGGFSLLTASRQDVDLFAFDAGAFARALPAGLLMYVVAVLAMRPRWRSAVESRKPIVRLFMPSNAAERAWWIAVSILAGISEEITWRGVQTMLLAAVVGNAVVASVICAILFGVAHAVQGPRSIVIITFFALGFQTLVALTGSLYLAMAVHFAYDVTAGIAYGRLGRKLGYDDPVATATA